MTSLELLDRGVLGDGSHPPPIEETRYDVKGAPRPNFSSPDCPQKWTSYPWGLWPFSIVLCPSKGLPPLPQAPALASSSLDSEGCAVQGQ